MSKHTPGPWSLCHHLQSPEKDASCPCGYRGGIWGSDGEHIVCEMGSTEIEGQEGMAPPRYDRATELANAALIAAAPDLLDVAKDFLILEVETCDCDTCLGWVKKLKTAISKAEGGA